MRMEPNDEREGADGGGAGGAGEGDQLRVLAEERGISEDVLRAAGIRLVPPGGRHGGWWGLPYPHRTGTWKLRYRNPDPGRSPKYLDDPGADFHLYNPLLLGPGEEEVWFAEGEFDTLSLIDQGLPAIGIHGATNAPKEDGEEQDESKRFRRSWQYLFEDTLCIVMFDPDEEGRKGGRRLARFLGGEVFDEWPDQYGDINDWHLDDPIGLAESLHRFRSRCRLLRGMES